MTTEAIPPTAPRPISGDVASVGGAQAGVRAPVQSQANTTSRQQPGVQPSALEAAVRTAAGVQGGLASLFADLAAALQSTELPEAVRNAAASVLGFQLPLDPPPTAEDLQQAAAQSGLFLEAQLANSNAPPANDLKAALLNLGATLEAASGEAAHPSPSGQGPAPPYRDGPTQAQPAVASRLAADASPQTTMSRLASDTGAAISRQVLMQAASAPGGARTLEDAATSRWLFEIPLATPQGTSIAQFEVDRDGSSSGQSEEEGPTWRARFSLDVDPMGPVHAKIVMNGGKVRVSLWAEDGETLERLSQQQAELCDALSEEDLSAQVAVFPGAPAVATPPKGRFMDKAI